MSIQITVDPDGMSQKQREAVAGFILAYPTKACAGTCGHSHSVNELEVLQHDHESTLPVAAFGQPDEAAAAFGVPPAPLPLGATAAPSTAGAAPLSTAPVAMVETTSTTTSTVPAPPAQMPANVAAIAAPQTGSPASGVELDKNGLPWDGRIHAESKAKIADGTWRSKRNLDPALKAQVEAELRQVMGAAPAAPLGPWPFPPAPSATEAALASPVTAPPAPAVAPAAAPGEVPADARAQFVALVGRASAAIQGQKVTQAEVNQCCVDAGVPALPLLANRLDLVAQVAAHIDALIAARQ